MKNDLTADELLIRAAIAAKIIGDANFDEDAIDAALIATHVEGISGEMWERETRRLLWQPLAERVGLTGGIL